MVTLVQKHVSKTPRGLPLQNTFFDDAEGYFAVFNLVS
jgi:hypothetical protein